MHNCRVCSNCKALHLASDLQYPARSKEMEFLKYKADFHLLLTEKVKSYADASKSDIKPLPNVMYKTDLEQTLDQRI